MTSPRTSRWWADSGNQDEIIRPAMARRPETPAVARPDLILLDLFMPEWMAAVSAGCGESGLEGHR
jgi:hypothetical protein